MLRKPKTCAGCPLYDITKDGFAIPEGTGKNGVLIIGEALGKNELYEGRPFRPHAEAGSVLEKAFRFLGVSRQDFALYNIVNCQPPNNQLRGMLYEHDAVNHCKQYVAEVIKRYKPKVILVLGEVPHHHMAENVGQTVTQIRGYILNQNKKYFEGIDTDAKIIASLHPSYIRRTYLVYLGVLIRDISAALALAKGEIPEFKYDYTSHPTEADIEDFLQSCKSNPSAPISYDIENPFLSITADESEFDINNFVDAKVDETGRIFLGITSIQFSNEVGSGIFLKWNDGTIPFTRKILALPNPKVSWNGWTHDKLYLEQFLGKGCVKGLNIDAMWYWKWFQQDFVKLGRALQFATNFYSPEFLPWKHLTDEKPEFYGVADVDATLRIYEGLRRDCKDTKLEKDVHGNLITSAKALEQGFLDDIVKLKPILERCSERGIPIDLKERAEFREAVQTELHSVVKETQKFFPNKLKSCKPPLGFKNVPKEVFYIKETFNSLHDFKKASTFLLTLPENGNDVSIPTIRENLVEKLTRKKANQTGLVLREFEKEKRYCRLEDFKPTSSQQVLRYVKYKGYKVPKKKDKNTGETRETSSKDEIHHLWESTGDNLLERFIYVRELRKLLSTYTGKTKKSWLPDEDGRVRTTFTFIPVTGQLSSINPNVQNPPKYGGQFASPGYKALATKFRKLIRAGEGKLLLELDFKSYHALTLGFEAEDADYIRLVRLDVHSFVAAHIIKNELEFQTKKLRGQLLTQKDEAKRKEMFEQLEKFNTTAIYLKDLDNWLKLPDEELKVKLKWIKKNYEFVRNRQAKPAILGIGFGMGANRLYKENIRSFATMQDAEKVLNLLRKLFPKLFEFQDKVRKMANRQGYLISRYGYIERFYNVYDYRFLNKKKATYRPDQEIFRGANGEWILKQHGTDGENAVAFYPANDAFGKIKEAMRECEELGYLEKYGLINQVHDSLLFECPEDLIMEAATNVGEVMQRPAKYLVNVLAPQGLICDVEASVGKNWGEMQELKLDGPQKSSNN